MIQSASCPSFGRNVAVESYSHQVLLFLPVLYSAVGIFLVDNNIKYYESPDACNPIPNPINDKLHSVSIKRAILILHGVDGFMWNTNEYNSLESLYVRICIFNKTILIQFDKTRNRIAHIWLQLVRLRSYQIHQMQLANCVSSIIVYTARHTLYLQFPVHFVEIGCKFANLYDEIVNLLKTVTWAAVASCGFVALDVGGISAGGCQRWLCL